VCGPTQVEKRNESVRGEASKAHETEEWGRGAIQSGDGDGGEERAEMLHV